MRLPHSLFWAGSSLEFIFTGGELHISLAADFEEIEPWIAVELNGAPLLRAPLDRGETQFCLFRGMTPGVPKRVRIFKETQPITGDPRHRLEVREIWGTGGEAAPAPSRSLHLEFVGDSLTSGEGLAGARQETDWVSPLFSASQSWARRTADKLGADFCAVSQSGWGVCSGWDGDRGHTLPRWYEETRPLRKREPDAVVVNLGTNDAAAIGAGLADIPGFRDGVMAFLKQLRADHRSAKLLWVYGMIDGPLGPCLRETVERFCRETGDQDACYLPLPAVTEETMGSRQHPGIPCHEAAAQAAADFLKTILQPINQEVFIMDYQAQAARWLERAVDDPDLIAELNGVKDDPAALSDRFYRDLAFGTGGLRGVIGAGTNRMNIYTVRRATQGLADYLNASGLPKSAVIAYDSRIKGELFARETARVLAANGITAYLYPRLEPTPALSWAVRYHGCGAGVCITASHNPAKYNGYKVYGADGCQITPEAADKVLAAIEQTDCFDGVKLVDFNAALEAGTIRYIAGKCLDDFVDAVLALRPGGDVSKLKLVYTPLNGSGLECVKKLLEKMGVAELTVVPSQEKPDGTFPTCPYPNPEIREAMEEGLRLCDEVHPDLLLGTDPDCDRMGAAVPDGKGGYRLISGNEMGVLLLDYLCRTRLARGAMPENPVAVTTIVSTDMAAPVAAEYGVELRRTLTGFKYIGEQIGLLEDGGQKERYIFGFEESYGYLSGSHVRDKDAVNAVMLACECAAWYAGQGKTLLDAMNGLYERFGFYRNGLISIAFEGQDGMRAMEGLMASLRADAPGAVAGRAVTKMVDYLHDDTGLIPSDVLELRLDGDAKLIVRPSGTEPKLKLYLSVRGESEAGALSALDDLTAGANALVRERRKK